jgi:BolA-like protein 1
MEVRSLSTSAAASEDKNRTSASESPSSSTTRYRGPLEQTIRDKLTAAFEPVVHLDVINESHMHNVPKNSETHFKVVVVSSDFDGMTIIQRHRKVNSVLADELQKEGGIHALSIVAKTPAQWNEMVKSGKAVIEPSPKCRGGDGSLPSKS